MNLRKDFIRLPRGLTNFVKKAVRVQNDHCYFGFVVKRDIKP